ncbi:MAG: coproporphyrinogen-III oxidase family protein [Clostridia bacterium]|nr:coproporphyrinogen-III oxidase family protein [Clostridia bacterium]
MLTEALRRMIAHKGDRYAFEPYKTGDIDFSSLPEEIGLYIHIPFCRRLCPFCPYNKTLYNSNLAARYYRALLKELELYRPFLGGKHINSIYLGGGTPTLMMGEIALFLEKLRNEAGFQGDVGIEVHPREATPENLAAARNAGINLVSVGVQSFHGPSLSFLERGYGPEESHQGVINALKAGFETVDVDLMYNIPGQSQEDMEKDLETCLSYGVEQVSIYPLIIFPLTPLHNKIKSTGVNRFSELAEYKIQRKLERVAERYGYQRTSIWTFGKKGVKRYTSVTRETFLGLGASATSLYNRYFYLNTFDVEAYIKALDSGTMPISLVNYMNEREKQVFWLFWRCYDTEIPRRRFSHLFRASLDRNFPLLTAGLKLLGLAKDQGEVLKLTPRGTFCFHFIEKQYSLRYLNNLWDVSMQNSWPKRLEL